MRVPTSCTGLVLFICGACTVLADGGNALLQLEKAPAAAGPWQGLPASVLSLTPDGLLADQVTNGAFYRLKITLGDVAGGPLAVPVATADPQAVQQAQAMLASPPGDGWANAVLAPYAYPVYDAAVNAGKDPAYLEFKVIPGSPKGGNGSSNAPIEPSMDLGYILVSLTPEDLPVPEMSQAGPTRVEQLRQLAGMSNIRAFRYGHGYLVGEDAQGNAVATIGSMPYKISQVIPTLGTATFEGQVVSNKVTVDPGPFPGNDSGLYASYAEFKQDYTLGPVFAYLLARRAETARFRWAIEAGQLPPVINVPLNVSTQVLTAVNLTGMDIEDTSVAIGSIKAGSPGIWLTGLQIGGTILHVVLSDGTTAYYAIQVGQTGSARPLGWTAWSYWWAGDCSRQRRYSQVMDLCHSGCWSGCGPTAWAMLYGWWDQGGPCNLIGSCGATPLNNDANVNACIQSVCANVGAFCAGSQGATLPSNECFGWHWAAARGHGISQSWNWGVPYLSSAPRNQAVAAIQAGRPAIVGTGFYNHYPLAWGYGYREWKDPIFGRVWTSARYWFVNEGWGGNPCAGGWVNADDCWFGNNTTCW